MFGGKLRFALSGIWANRRSRGGGRGVEDASGHRRVPKEPALAMMGQGRPELSLPVQTPVCGLPARSAIWAPPPPCQLASLAARLPHPQIATAAAQKEITRIEAPAWWLRMCAQWQPAWA